MPLPLQQWVLLLFYFWKPYWLNEGVTEHILWFIFKNSKSLMESNSALCSTISELVAYGISSRLAIISQFLNNFPKYCSFKFKAVSEHHVKILLLVSAAWTSPLPMENQLLKVMIVCKFGTQRILDGLRHPNHVLIP